MTHVVTSGLRGVLRRQSRVTVVQYRRFRALPHLIGISLCMYAAPFSGQGALVQWLANWPVFGGLIRTPVLSESCSLRYLVVHINGATGLIAGAVLILSFTR